MPKVETSDWTKHDGVPNALTGQNDGPYAEINLSEIIGLSQFRARLECLPPGSRSSHRHWHEAEDEFVYVISGKLVLVEDTETSLSAGDAAGWPGGQSTAHCLENRSGGDAVVLVVGTKLTQDVVHYPDHGIVLHRDGASRTYSREDGSPI